MNLSSHNILSKIHQSDEYFIVNLLSGNADILSEEEGQKVIDGKILNDPEFIKKGYVVDKESEIKVFRSRYLDFIDARDNGEIQIFYVPTYACNFGCSYCYQNGYEVPPVSSGTECAAAFFKYITSNFAGRNKYVTLFGGEPLLPADSNKLLIDYIVARCNELNLDLAVVTNGYYLKEFIPILTHTRIREIQITLDGPETIHNSRRFLKSGQGTFNQIVDGIDYALSAKLPVNLRVVIDRNNIDSLHLLAKFAIEKGWTDLPEFKTQIGRNYELHYCQPQQSRLYTRIELFKDLYDQIKKYPDILRFHKPAFSISKFLFENGELPDPLFDSCPACKTEWAFDYTGNIYSCTATVGKPGESLGTFYPDVKLDPDQVMRWQQRDIISIPGCNKCNVSLACGGGCASVAMNRHNELYAPDCRPVKELLEMGIAMYREIV